MIVVEIVHEILADAFAQYLFDVGDVRGQILLAERRGEESAESRHNIVLEAVRLRDRNDIVFIRLERWVRNLRVEIIKCFTLRSENQPGLSSEYLPNMHPQHTR